MEIKQTQSFSQRLFQSMKQYTDSLLNDSHAIAVIQPFIMPLQQIKRMLHDHYVSQTSITVTFEYFNQQQYLVEKTITVFVKTPIRHDGRIVLEEIGTSCPLLLSIEQILRIKK